ncbi:GNAT family N-acetyltransferase [Nitrincola sp. MINF-07-Sa-05]|uniref:GNAT family N-acetyltransferase n=1 Tax=Nitrincola salilacus TaxID=3400273 RepID=UPI003918595A
MSNEMSKRLQTYELTLRDLREADIPKLHELSVGVGWPHRPDDWRMLLQLGKGYVGCDKIGRIVGSAMWFPIADNFATTGMVITSPRLQASGGGRWLMKHVMQQCEGRNIRVNATKESHRLFTSLQFKTLGTVCQHQGIAINPGIVEPRVEPTDGAQLRKLEAADLAEIVRLDKAAFGVDRTVVFKVLLGVSKGTVLIRNEQMIGFALCRKFGRGYVIGPVVAQNDTDAIALIAPYVASHAGQFLRVDTARGDGEFTEFLIRCGLQEYGRVTTMAQEQHPLDDTGIYTFALASHTLG